MHSAIFATYTKVTETQTPKQPLGKIARLLNLRLGKILNFCLISAFAITLISLFFHMHS